MKSPSELKTYALPEAWTDGLSGMLAAYSLDLNDSLSLAKSIRRLSDFYIEYPQRPTPYHEEWAQVASLVYFFPLNYLRARAVVDAGEAVGFFAGLTELVDFGSGLGPLGEALADAATMFKRQICIDRAKEAHALHRHRQGLIAEYSQHLEGSRLGSHTLLGFSYSLVEVERLPVGYQRSEALLILEPSTQDRGRHLQTLRGQLLQEGYHIWAPCTHQHACPLLEHSQRDWCHQRIALKMPGWWQAIEDHLPMRNTTLTFAYLLARRLPPPRRLSGATRVLGDWLREKGKHKQLICRSAEREFLARLKKHCYNPQHKRGDLIVMPQDCPKAGNELRPEAAPMLWLN